MLLCGLLMQWISGWLCAMDTVVVVVIFNLFLLCGVLHWFWPSCRWWLLNFVLLLRNFLWLFVISISTRIYALVFFLYQDSAVFNYINLFHKNCTCTQYVPISTYMYSTGLLSHIHVLLCTWLMKLCLGLDNNGLLSAQQSFEMWCCIN